MQKSTRNNLQKSNTTQGHSLLRFKIKLNFYLKWISLQLRNELAEHLNQISSLGHWIEQVVITWLQYIIEHYRINICMNFNVSYFYFHSGLHVITVFEPLSPQYQCLSSYRINFFELSINVWIQDWPPLRNLWNKSFWMSRWVWAFNSHNLSVSTPFLMAPLYGRGS